MKPIHNLTPSQAAARLGVSAKALRLYERHGLIQPGRTAAGWRVYGHHDLERATNVASLRGIGLSLSQIDDVLHGDSTELERALNRQQARLGEEAQRIAARLDRIRSLRRAARRARASDAVPIGFDLPWPWGGEWFELGEPGALNFITGPLGSGKTRFARRLAEEMPDAAFVGLERETDLPAGPGNGAAVERRLRHLIDAGARDSDSLRTLLTILESRHHQTLVVDMVEQGLDECTQRVLIGHLRQTARLDRPLFLMTRSSSILELEAVGPDELVILCPANHAPPFRVAPVPGGRGHDALLSCLATPEVRARTAGVVAVRQAATGA